MKDHSEAIKKATDRGYREAISSFASNSWLMGLVNHIPSIGPSISALVSANSSKFIESRIEDLFGYINNMMQNIEEDKIDRGFLKSEEFFDILVVAMKNTAQTRHRIKIKRYAKILSGSVIAENRSVHNPEQYLKITSDLSEEEFKILSIIWRQQKEPPTSKDDNLYLWAMDLGWKKLSDGSTDIKTEDLPYLLSRLEGMGLAMNLAGTAGVSTDISQPRIITLQAENIWNF